MNDTITSSSEVIEKIGFAFSKRDPKELERRLKESEDYDRRQAASKIADVLSASGIPKRHKCVTINPDGQWGETMAKLDKMRGTGFLAALVGTRGNGKTQIAVELVRENAKQLVSSKFCCTMEFFIDIKATFRSDKESERDVIKAYQKPSLLVLDEIGQRSETDWENRLLFHLINQRYEDSKDTLLIANLEPDQLASAIGPSISSRMNETGGIFHCNWPSFR
jgi:DNA replication protein DnaC